MGEPYRLGKAASGIPRSLRGGPGFLLSGIRLRLVMQKRLAHQGQARGWDVGWQSLTGRMMQRLPQWWAISIV